MDRASTFTIKSDSTIRGSHDDSIRSAPPHTYLTRIVGAALLCLLSLNAAGCSLFHHGDSPQQQFMNALNRGNGPQASQLYLKMSAEDRANLSHNIGFKNTADKDDVGHAMLKHQQEDEATRNAEDPDPLAAQYNGDTDSQQVEVPGILAGGLSNLPGLSTPSSAPITEIGPQ